VGIGSTAPTATLDVNGTAVFSTSVSSASIFGGDSTMTNLVATNLTASTLSLTNAAVTNATITNLLNTNISSSQGIITHLATTNETNSNLLNTNLTSTNAIITNAAITSGTTSNLVNTAFTSGGAVITNVVSTNETNSNLLNTNFTSTNAVVSHLLNTNITSTNAIITNIASTNETNSNFLNTNMTSTNAIITNAAVTNSSIGTINITGTANSSSVTEGGVLVVEGGARIAKNLFVGGPALQIPKGDTASRPAAPQQGYVRYNTEYSQFEGFGAGSAWGSLGGVSDIAQTTKILASSSPGVTDGNLYFYNVGSENMRLNSSGNLGIGTSTPAYKLDVVGTLRATGGDITVGTLNLTSTNIALGANTTPMTAQGMDAIAIGNNAGNSSQGMLAIAVGSGAGATKQGLFAIALGLGAGNNWQGTSSVAVGPNAGSTSQGNYAVAIGNAAGATKQHNNSIILNASGSPLNSSTAGAFYVSSVRNVTQANLLAYDTTLKEVTYFSLSDITTSNLVATNISSGTLSASVGATLGSLNVTGGAIINTVDVTPNFGDISKERSFSLANGSSGVVSGFAFNGSIVRGFQGIATVQVVCSDGEDLYANFDLRGIQLKNSMWVMSSVFVGDKTGVDFTINTSGQVMYTSTSIGNYTSSNVKFRALTTNV
jgi:hypothetical protein